MWVSSSLRSLRPGHGVSVGFALGLAALLGACGPATLQLAGGAQGASTPAVSGAALQASQAPSSSKVQLTFVDLDGFDKQVEQALASGAPEVEIEMIAGMSPNQIAPRLGRWLNAVQENGGDLKVTGAARTRNLGLLATLGQAAYKAWTEQRLKSLVKGLSAEVAMRDDKIEKVTLRRK